MNDIIKSTFHQITHIFSGVSEKGVMGFGHTLSFSGVEVVAVSKPLGTAYLIYVPDYFEPAEGYPEALIVSAEKPALSKTDAEPEYGYFPAPGDFILYGDKTGEKLLMDCYTVAVVSRENQFGEAFQRTVPLEEKLVQTPVCLSPAVMHIFVLLMEKMQK